MIKYILKDQGINANQFVSETHKMMFLAQPFSTQKPKDTEFNPQETTSIIQKIMNDSAQTTTDFTNICEIGIQTISREEYCQTDPYTPQEIVKPNDNPEILSLKKFKWGKQLPPTIEELMYIEEQREKRAFEASLPPLSDEFSFNLRRKIMEHQEIHEWQKRENEIKKNQSKKLNLLQNMLIEREKTIEENNYFRIDTVKNVLNQQKNMLVVKIQARKTKAIRKLSRIEKQFHGLKRQSNIIEKYQNFGSEVYASIMRNGFSLERFSDRFKTDLKSLSNFELYKELINGIEPENFTIKISIDEMNEKTERKYLKIEKYNLLQLKKAQESLECKLSSKNNPNFGDIYDLNIQNVVPRPDTPYYEERPELANYPHQEVNLDRQNIKPQEERIAFEDAKHKLASAIQRLLRGRAIQNVMFEGKEKRLALIDELLIVANTTSKSGFEETKIIEKIKEEQKIDAEMKSFQGSVVSKTLEVLNKELLKVYEAKKLSEFVKNAQQTRQKREIEETGKRQAKMILKTREEKMYNDIINVHKETTNCLLKDIFDFSTDFLSEKESCKLTEIKEKKFTNYVQKNNENYEVLIKDFLHLFLVPNIDRKKLQEMVNNEQKKGKI